MRSMGPKEGGGRAGGIGLMLRKCLELLRYREHYHQDIIDWTFSISRASFSFSVG